jgi:hypothetical protein
MGFAESRRDELPLTKPKPGGLRHEKGTTTQKIRFIQFRLPSAALFPYCVTATGL